MLQKVTVCPKCQELVFYFEEDEKWNHINKCEGKSKENKPGKNKTDNNQPPNMGGIPA